MDASNMGGVHAAAAMVRHPQGSECACKKGLPKGGPHRQQQGSRESQQRIIHVPYPVSLLTAKLALVPGAAPSHLQLFHPVPCLMCEVITLW